MKKQKGYVIGAVVLAAIILIVIFMRPKGMSIVPNEYVKVTCSGLNGEGKARISFDAQSFLNDIKAEKKMKPAQESEIQGLQKQISIFSFPKTKGCQMAMNFRLKAVCRLTFLNLIKLK